MIEIKFFFKNRGENFLRRRQNNASDEDMTQIIGDIQLGHVKHRVRFMNSDGTFEDDVDPVGFDGELGLRSDQNFGASKQYLIERRQEIERPLILQAAGRQYIRYFIDGDRAYVLRSVGGNGWSLGCGSAIEVFENPEKGKQYTTTIPPFIS